MIIDSRKIQLPEDPTPTDAPPSYDTLIPLDSSALTQVQDSKTSHYPPPNPPWRPAAARPSSSIPSSSSLTPSTSSNTKGKSWFNFAANRTEKDVRNTVIGLVRDLVREHHSPDSSAPAGILQSCAAACEAHSISLSALLQERSIEGHTPLYWAIVKRKPDEELDEYTQIPDLLIALLSHSTPLTKNAIMDVRHACLITSDQRLFQRLRMSPEFATVSGTDQMLLGVTLPHDEIEVVELPGDEGDFAVDFVVPHFQKRMMVTQHIVLEFIARCRMWKLSFDIAPPIPSGSSYGPKAGSWTISLSLQDNSPPTWIDSHITVHEPPDTAPTGPLLLLSPTPVSPGSGDASPSLLQSASSTFGFAKPKPKTRPPIDVRLPCRERLSVPASTSYSRGYRITVCLEDNPAAATLQYAGNPYIAADEKLRFRLEAKLRMPQNECVIC